MPQAVERCHPQCNYIGEVGTQCGGRTNCANGLNGDDCTPDPQNNKHGTSAQPMLAEYQLGPARARGVMGPVFTALVNLEDMSPHPLASNTLIASHVLPQASAGGPRIWRGPTPAAGAATKTTSPTRCGASVSTQTSGRVRLCAPATSSSSGRPHVHLHICIPATSNIIGDDLARFERLFAPLRTRQAPYLSLEDCTSVGMRLHSVICHNASDAAVRTAAQNAPAPVAVETVPERPAFMDALAAEVKLPADVETYVPLLPPAPPSPPPTSPTLLPGLLVQALRWTPMHWLVQICSSSLDWSNSLRLGKRSTLEQRL